MQHYVKASSAGSNEGNGSSRGVVRRAVAASGASSETKGSGARSYRRPQALLAVLALTIAALVLTASSAIAAEPVPPTIDSVSEVSYASAHVTGTIDNLRPNYWVFEVSSDGGATWDGCGAFCNFLEGGGGPTTVEADLNLRGGTQYEVRLSARYHGGSAEPPNPELHSEPPNLEFTTLPVDPPSILSIDDASEVSYTSARVTGKVERPENPASPPFDPNPAFNVNCNFEYITDAAFSQTHTEQQKLSVAAGAGTYILTFNGQSTGPLAFDAAAIEVQVALNSLTSISGPGGSVVVSGGPGDEAGSAPYAIEFAGGLSQTNVGQISAESSGLTGSASVVTNRPGRAEGFEGAAPTGCEPEDPIATPGANLVSANLTQLAPDTTYHLRLVVSNAGGQDAEVAASTFPTLPVPPPSVTIATPTAVTANSVHLSGEINPLAPAADPAFEVNWHFECSPECPGLQGGSIAPDGDPHQVSAEAAGLQPNTSYEVTLVASNAGGDGSAGPVSFTTDAPSPVAQTLGVGDLQPEATTLSARINPLNSPVSYQFEWGDTQAYGAKAPATLEPLGSIDNAFHVVTAPLAGLQPATSYHYRIVAINTQTGATEPGQDRVFMSPPAIGPTIPCLNETSRVGASAGLPDCRAYEWVTPDINRAIVGGSASAQPDGDALFFNVIDPPDRAESGETPFNESIARRGPGGWSSMSLLPPLPGQVTSYNTSKVKAVSQDLSQSIVASNQPLAGPGSPSEMNAYLHRADGSFVALTEKGQSVGPLVLGCCTASKDFTHIFLRPVKQNDEDPVSAFNAYEWFGGNLQLIGILPGPNHEPAPQGASLPGGALPPFSDDGTRVLFIEGVNVANGDPIESTGPLYLRKDGLSTVEVSGSKISADPNPLAPGKAVGITADGAEVLFTSASELTEDANTGETEGVPNDSGADLYSFEVESGTLTDLTVDNEPADSATGANVLEVVGASKDGSYIYFIATGALAPGGISGDENLYVEHDGAIDFIAPATGMRAVQGRSKGFYLAPGGRYAVFGTTDSLTGYDNLNPGTSQREVEIFKYSYGGSLECASCPPDGEPPAAGALIRGRAVSNDGTRVFFQSSDAIVPQASSGLSHIYEYKDGEARLLTAGDLKLPVTLIDASESGNDVFLETHEELVPGAGSSSAVYDARVNATPSKASEPKCLGEACRGPGTTQTPPTDTGSANFHSALKLGVPRALRVDGATARLRITVPAKGQIKVSGKGIVPAAKRVSKPGSTEISVALKNGANRTRRSHGVFNTKARLIFTSSAETGSSGVVAISFHLSPRKGGK